MICELPQITESVSQRLVQEGNLGRMKIIMGSQIILREAAAFFFFLGGGWGFKYIFFKYYMVLTGLF